MVLDLAHIAAADGFAADAHAYWLATYAGRAGTMDAFTYTPVALSVFQAISAFLPWPVFLELYSLAIGAGVWILAGPFTLPLAFTPWVATEITLANIHVFLALVAVAGLRWPALFSVALLTKVTPGVGLLWFVFRREWWAVAVALSVTAALALPTLIFAPELWVDWLRVVGASSGVQSALPLAVRLPLAVAVVWIGARRTWRWTVPLAMMIALPVLWDVHGLSMLLGSLWFLRRRSIANAIAQPEATGARPQPIIIA